MCPRLTQASHLATYEARRRSHLEEKNEIGVGRAGEARPPHTNFFSPQRYDLGVLHGDMLSPLRHNIPKQEKGFFDISKRST